MPPEVAAIVGEHGTDTLAFFKLRSDLEHVLDPGRSGVAGFRVHAGVLMVAADPVGPPGSLEAMARVVAGEARRRGLKLAVFAASEEGRRSFGSLGLRSLYLGDEAIIETARFSLSGRPIRKVRQSVTRARRAGFTLELTRLGDLDAAAVGELQALADRARGGAPEHGFAMEMPSLVEEHLDDTLVLIARDEEGSPRGLLHLVPCAHRPALSLSLMRRDFDAPNGLNEFMVAGAVEQIRERGLEELSLAFATFGRWIAAPESQAERALGRIARVGDRWFQIESLYRFNAKFFPRSQPRYLMYEGRLGLPRAGLAAMRAEGLLP